MSNSAKKYLSKCEYETHSQTLQAIIFADDFIHDLTPVQRFYPSILLPIVNSPLFDYLLETLARSRVQQVFLYCSKHVEKLKGFIDSLKLQDNNIIITPIISDGCRSLGDALRDIDTKGCIRGDFILIRGFINADLRILMDLHEARKGKDKNTAMTMVFSNFGSTKDSALKSESSYIVSNANTRKLLYYKQLTSDDKKIELELQWFLEQDKVLINTALFDTGVYLCSQSVLTLFADNFDFQTMEDFIRGVLINEEFLDSRIYWESLPSPAYALPLNSWKSYRIISRDILQRQCYPLVPDTLPLPLRNFTYMSRSTYKHCSSILHKGCILHSESIVGENSTIGENSSINKSIIGSRCTIGANVCINNSFIFENVTIKDDCNINNCIIFANCKLEKNIKLDTCILLPNVESVESCSNTVVEINEKGKIIFKKMEEQLENNDYDFSTIFDVDNDVDNDGDASSCSSVSSAWSSPSSRDSPIPPALQDDNESFLSEVIDSLLRGYQDKLKCENLILEINSSRYAYNISMQQVSYNVIKAILNLPLLQGKTTSNSKTQSADYHRTLKTMLTYFMPIITNYIKTKSAQEDCLRAIEDITCSNEEVILPCAQNLLHFFYDNDILLEEKIIQWYEEDYDNQEIVSDDDLMKKERKQNIIEALRTAVLPFIKWLKEAEEDSSDSS